MEEESRSRLTLYVNNLNEKVPVHVLKKHLEEAFQEYGKILNISIKKNLRLKGQAFVTYHDTSSSTRAMAGLQDLKMLGKPIRVVLANENSFSHYLHVDEKDAIKHIQANRKTKKPAPALRKKSHWESLPPNSVLLFQNLLSNLDEGHLSEVFDKYPGYITSRAIKVRNLAFVEFDNEEVSTDVLKTSDHEELKATFGPECLLTYAKK